jgi:hypothetical protein
LAPLDEAGFDASIRAHITVGSILGGSRRVVPLIHP